MEFYLGRRSVGTGFDLTMIEISEGSKHLLCVSIVAERRQSFHLELADASDLCAPHIEAALTKQNGNGTLLQLIGIALRFDGFVVFIHVQ